MITNNMNSITDVVDRATILTIAMISVLVSLLTLGIPLAAQTLINLIAFGKLLQPVLTLSVIVLILMLAVGALNIWQIIIIEVIQQKLMVKISLNLTQQFTHLSLENFSVHRGPELVNRFFEVVTIKKNLASLLLYGINLGLQLIFGMILLLIYHPLFLLFDAFILLGLALIVFIPYRKGLESAKAECYQKHQVGSWLEEILINRFLFRLNRYYNYATAQTDKSLVSFLKARNIHFRQLIKHQIGFYILSALASSLLLGMGGYLVISNQLSLGQLVAAEIVLGAMIYSFKRFGVLLENYYDLVASTQKIDELLDLPIETINSQLNRIILPIQSIQFINKKGEEFTVSKANPLLILPDKWAALQKPGELILGFRDEPDFKILVNETLCSVEQRRLLRDHALLIGKQEWFAGSIFENLRLNQSAFPKETLNALLKSFGLINKIIQLPDGIHTVVYEWKSTFTETELIQLMIIRAILVQPQLLIIDSLLDKLTQAEIDSILEQLLKLQNTLLIVISHSPELFSLTNSWVVS